MNKRQHPTGNGNVFQAFGIPNAEEHLLNAQLVFKTRARKGTRSAGAGGITVASRCPFSAAEGISASTGPMFATGSEPKKPKGGNDEGTKRLHIPQREELVCAVLR